MLTRDKVSLRVNLAASIRVTDPVAARTRVAKFGDYVYREPAVRPAQGDRRQDAGRLLGDKASLDADIFGYVRGRVTELGIEVLGVGVKDVILPGEMKDILNSVVQAEKAAQVNVIRRREEANATRSPQHRQADRGQPGADAPEGARDPGEGHREDRQAHRVRRPGWRAEAAGDDEGHPARRKDASRRFQRTEET